MPCGASTGHAVTVADGSLATNGSAPPVTFVEAGGATLASGAGVTSTHSAVNALDETDGTPL